jgi:hypothetical protein
MRTLRIGGGVTRTRLLAALTVFALVIIVGQASVPADNNNSIIRVEEDWQLQIIAPATDETSPQITNTISPTQNLTGFYGVFELNHGTQPNYDDGGLELQMWQGPTEVIYNRYPDTSRLKFANETVTYTIAMSLQQDAANRQLRVSVKNGNSQTWGTFGQNGSLRATTQWTDLPDLNWYSPQFSVDNSKIGYASFRVQRFSLTAVRYYTANGTVTTDNTERVVFQYNPKAVISE